MQGVLHTTLIIRLSSVGDIVLSSPLVRSLHARHPGCRIDFLTKSAYADLVRYNPHVARVIEFPEGGSFAELRRLRHAIASSGYDLIIDIHDSIRSRLLCAGMPHVVRIHKRRIARALLVRCKIDLYDRFGGAPPVTERYIETVASYGVTNDGGGPDLWTPASARSAAETILQGEGIRSGNTCIGVCGAARHWTKIWPAERFAEAAGGLASRRHMPVLLFGSADDREHCAAIARMIAASFPGTAVVDLAGRMPLLETAVAMEHCALILTNDTGLMHIATARRVPVVALFGSTVRQFGFFPPPALGTVVERSDLACRPCTSIGRSTCPKKHFRCMNDISVAMVIAAAERRLEGSITP
jgi:heptosyltransferase-2